jgi:hypothetical protein
VREFVFDQAGPTSARVGELFKLSVSVELAAWLSFSAKAPTRLAFTLPPNVTCDKTTLERADLSLSGRRLSGTVTCSAASKGSYEARGDVRFGYDNPNGSTGIGADGARWKFQITP